MIGLSLFYNNVTKLCIQPSKLCHPEWNEVESKDLRTDDLLSRKGNAQILRLPPVAQNDTPMAASAS